MSYRDSTGMEWWDISPSVSITSKMKPCFLCQKPTVYVELDFQCYLCYPDCVDAMTRDYIAAASR